MYVFIYMFVYVYKHHTSCVSTVHHVPKCMRLPQNHSGNNRERTLFFMITYILRPSCFCEI